MNKEKLSYLLIRFLTAPFSWMPYRWIQWIGKRIGSLLYFCMRDYRKRALSNLALADNLALSPSQIRLYARQSFQNLAITCLEYPRFSREKNLSRVIHCENPELSDSLHKQGKGIIFFCGHQSNWEVLFLEGTTRMRGIAIGRDIKNKLLYKWILSIREKNGGKIVAPRNAVREGLRALRKGAFIGIVGDQGMPNSGYSFPFLGRRAWTTTAPALLAYKTNSPIIFASTHRIPGGYRIRYSDPIWPNLKESIETEVIRMMDQALNHLQASIKFSPGEWLWQHNRWKQQTPQIVYKRFRYDSICIILPQEKEAFERIYPHLATLREIYALNFLFLLMPDLYRSLPLLPVDEVIYYKTPEEVLRPDYRFKLIFDFTSSPSIQRHYEKLSAFETFDLLALQKIAAPHLTPEIQQNPSEIFKRALCRPGTLWKPEHAS